MPNWCFNELRLTGDLGEIKDFNSKNLDKDNDLDFNIEVPIPSERESDWFSWNINNWGTKWSANETCSKFHWKDQEERNLDYLLYSFNTAWSPPTQWLATVSTKYPNIHFNLKYGEWNMNFSGYYEAKNGEITSNEGKYGEYFGELLDNSDLSDS